MHDLKLQPERLDSDVVRALISALNGELSRLYPEPGATHFRLDPEEIAPGRGVFLVAYMDERSIGCGAIRLVDEGIAEVKRMYVVPEERGRGIGKLVLAELEREARSLGARRLVLETGTRQPEALAMYRSAGFAVVDPFGEYIGSPLSVCMSKMLRSA
jgi:putative acetyltransferase